MTGKKFFAVTVLNVAITVAEFVGGILSGSLSLISDAFHNLGDSLSIVFSYVANVLSTKRQDARNTYGYKRAQIITAFLNSIALVIICAFLVIEAVQRLSHPEPINGPLMLAVAVIGLVANGVSAYLLNRGSKNNLNMKATYLHIMSDALSSVAIIIGGVLIELFNWTLVDPIVTILVAVYIAYESLPIIRQTNGILMEGAPAIDYRGIKRDLMQIDGVLNVHHVHAWQIDENNIVFSAHVNLYDMKISEAEPIYSEIDRILKKKYHVCHSTIQAEAQRGKDEDIIYDQGEDIG
ncbi:cation diffusion facilitator family transporter [Lentilactobacillus sp. Marseille-Q4993]|uniref:cation diffusion facilitator family transporter n=1 Tax=Lentilactobacillus sp. Marseille-Q4993 TaxID=3039492 RepID=UPI0024BC44B6|nr:cation diffusion facilitator family transporter [Lentilactobacillus sp. Marseille-Q4993]